MNNYMATTHHSGCGGGVDRIVGRSQLSHRSSSINPPAKTLMKDIREYNAIQYSALAEGISFSSGLLLVALVGFQGFVAGFFLFVFINNLFITVGFKFLLHCYLMVIVWSISFKYILSDSVWALS